MKGACSNDSTRTELPPKPGCTLPNQGLAVSPVQANRRLPGTVSYSKEEHLRPHRLLPDLAAGADYFVRPSRRAREFRVLREWQRAWFVQPVRQGRNGEVHQLLVPLASDHRFSDNIRSAKHERAAPVPERS